MKLTSWEGFAINVDATKGMAVQEPNDSQKEHNIGSVITNLYGTYFVRETVREVLDFIKAERKNKKEDKLSNRVEEYLIGNGARMDHGQLARTFGVPIRSINNAVRGLRKRQSKALLFIRNKY